MILARYFMLATLIVVSLNTKAQTINDLVRQIVVNNPDLQNRALSITADKLDADDANALANPEVGFSRVWGKDGVGNKLQLDISQSFDWPGAYRSRSLANDAAEAAALQRFAADRLDVAQSAKQALVELVYLRKQRQVLDEMVSSMKHLNDVIDRSLEKGHITILDQKKTRFESYKLESQLATVDAREQEVTAQLQSMAGGAALVLNGVQEYPLERLLSREEYLELAANADPAVAAGNLAAKQSELSAKAAGQGRFPTFTVGYEHLTEIGDRFNGFTLGMTLPFFENRHARKAQLLRKEAAERAVEQTLADNRADINSKYSSLAIWKDRMDQYRDVFGDNSYPALLRKSYEGGEINVIDYINESNYYLDNTLNYLETEYNYYLILSDINKYTLLEYLN